MDWSFLGRPEFIAPLAGLVGVLIGSGISAWTTRSIHRERLAADQNLAERKFEFDKDLAEKRLAFDRALVIWRRRYDLAEQILTTAYEARDILIWARAPVWMSGEGETRKSTEPEHDRLREKRNSYYVPIERLARETKTFSTLQTLQYAGAAHFGQDIIKPLAVITGVYKGIESAASILIQKVQADDDRDDIQSLMSFREVLGRGTRPDATDAKLNEAIAQIEAICKPVLSEKPQA